MKKVLMFKRLPICYIVNIHASVNNLITPGAVARFMRNGVIQPGVDMAGVRVTSYNTTSWHYLETNMQ